MLNGETKKQCEERNLRFYKLLGQNYETLINSILRGKDIYYEVPKEYQLNTRKPFILDWFLEFGRPEEIAKVRSFGPVKLLCVYNALMTWIDQNPSEEEKWLYKEEWQDYFKNNPKAFQKPSLQKPTKPRKKVENKKEEVEVVIPEMEFFTKKGNYIITNGSGDVFITINEKKGASNKIIKLSIHFRNSCFKKFESEYIIFAPYENRIYFKQSDLNHGFKLTNKTQKGNRAVIMPTIQKKDISKFEPFCKKELPLKYDELYKMYYVEIEKE